MKLIREVLHMSFFLVLSQSVVQGSSPRQDLLAALEARHKEANAPIAMRTISSSHGTIALLSGRLTGDIRGRVEPEVSAFLKTYHSLFGFSDFETQFELASSLTDRRGMAHVTYQQLHRGVPVLHHTLKAHTDAAGRLSSISNDYYPGLTLDVSPSLDELTAVALALSHLGHPNARTKDASLIIYTRTAEPALAYTFDMAAGMDSRQVIVDAHTGDVLASFPLIYEAGPMVGSGILAIGDTVHNLQMYEGVATSWGEVQSVIDLINSDNGYPAYSPVTAAYNLVDESNLNLGSIYTLTMSDTAWFEIDYVNSDTSLFFQEGDSLSHPGGVSAHFYHRKALDYFYELHGRRSWDDDGMRIIGLVDLGPSVGNAYYYGYYNVMVYGSGTAATVAFSAALDVVGHEFAHGFTAYTSDLIYENQSGALSEHISDVFGYLVEEYVEGEASDWFLGEDLYPPPSTQMIRNMADPTAKGQPDHMNHRWFVPYAEEPSDENDQGGVHTNSGIPNKVFYLLVEGGRHYNYDVSAFDVNTDSSRYVASQVWYNWNAYYLSPWDDFYIAREKMMHVSQALYPENTHYYSAIQTAWSSVGVHRVISVEQSASYIAAGGGELIITANLPWIGSNAVVWVDILQGDTLMVDSLAMTDDGLQGDGAPLDSTWGARWTSTATEAHYSYNITARDTATGFEEQFYLAGRFTTIGPIGLHTYATPWATEPISPGDDIYFVISLRNSGSTTSADNISAIFTPENDISVTILSQSDYTLGDIAPGDTSGIIYYSVRLSENVPGDNDIRFFLSIASEGYTFWSDTFSVHINPLGVAQNESALPTEFALHPAYPNPFNPVTTLRYDLPEAASVQLIVYDIIGRELVRLRDGSDQAGYHSVIWNGRDNGGRELPSGIYIARLRVPPKAGVTPEYTKSIKMLLLK